MRILMWEQVRKEHEGSAAFNVALLRAIDPRLITHQPRDPEKDRLMTELGMETREQAISRSTGTKKNSRRCLMPDLSKFDIGTDTECDISDQN